MLQPLLASTKASIGFLPVIGVCSETCFFTFLMEKYLTEYFAKCNPVSF